ncbi:tRNA lysidine(34) synthetase TilS [Limosilactobacillus sp.]|uniref:tRNA lysidine(34) synthetase TilS n=1 Tax=Limosilactobacillus sp. TaxID=2773925 RepID=UPI003EFE1FA4
MSKLEEDFKRHLQRGRFFTNNDRVVVAVSTGVDSMTLLDLLLHLPSTMRPQIVVAHVNHLLRAQSVEEESFIRDYCQQHNLELRVTRWPQDQHPATGVEAAARQFRYHFFAATMAATNAHYLLTAHHQNDLAETMLMKLVRGGQLGQLVGIRDQRPFAGGQLVRPLLPFAKQRLRSYARAHHLKWYEDQTNNDLAITRNRYRHQIIPALEEENPRLLDHLSAYHQQLTDLITWADGQLDRQLAAVESGNRLVVERWQKLPVLDRRLVLERWLEQTVSAVKQPLIEEVLRALADNQVRPQREWPLPNNYTLVIDYGKCFVQPPQKKSVKGQKYGTTVVELGQWYWVNTREQIMLTAGPAPEQATAVQEMWLAPAQWPLRLRLWRPGDALRLKGGGRQKVRRVLIDQKVPNRERDQQLVLVDATGTVVWLIGRKWSWFDRPTDYRQRWRRVKIAIQEQ